MEYTFILEFSVRKGLGPEWVRKDIEQHFDDVEPWVPEHEVKQWAIDAAKEYLRGNDCPAFTLVDVQKA